MAEFDSPCESVSGRKTLDCDREAWLVDQLALLVRMTRDILANPDVDAHALTMKAALEGAIHGCAREIAFSIFYHDLEYKNIKKLDSLDIPRIRQRTTRINL